MKFIILFFLFISLSIQTAFADPITQYEALKFEDLIRVEFNLGEDVDLLEYVQKKIKSLENKTELTHEEIRDLAEFYHLAGHFAEHRYDYPLALDYHRRSLPLYQKNKLRIRGSWNGPLHAVEHIFMDFFDQGIKLGREGKVTLAEQSFLQAYDAALENEVYRTLMQTRRFPGRFLTLLKIFSPGDYEKQTRSYAKYLSDNGYGERERREIMGVSDLSFLQQRQPLLCKEFFSVVL